MSGHDVGGPLPQMKQVFLFCALFVSYAFFLQDGDDNSRSRLAQVRAVADRGELNIDPDRQTTIDMSYYDGRYYSNKTVGASILSLPAYYTMRKLFPGASDSILRCVLAIWVSAIPAALAVLLFMKFAGILLEKQAHAAYLAAGLAFAWGSHQFAYATLFYGEVLAGFCAITGVHFITGSQNRPLLAGFFLGYAGMSFYFMVPACIAALLVLGWRKPRGILLPAAIGAALAMLPQAVYNWACFGAPWRIGHLYAPPGSPFVEAWKGGFIGFQLPSFAKLLQILFGMRDGLAFTAPVLLLAPIGYYYWHRTGKNRRLLWASVAIIAAHVLLTISFHDPAGGLTLGPRYLVPAMPFMCLGLWFVAARPRWNFLFFTLLGISVAIQLAAVVAGPHIPQEPGVSAPLHLFWKLSCADWGRHTMLWLAAGLQGKWVVLPYLAAVGFFLYMFNRASAGK